MDMWLAIRQLKGKTLRTLDRNNPFDVVDITEQMIVVRPHASGIERTIRRKEIEPAFQELRARGMIERVNIRERYSNFNPAYVAAILVALPGVRCSVKPIRLYLDKPGSR